MGTFVGIILSWECGGKDFNISFIISLYTFFFNCPPLLCVHVAVTSLKRETDALKLASVRAGLLELSQSWASLGRKCALLAESQMVRHNDVESTRC